MYKNKAGQKVAIFAWDGAAGAAKTEDAANITAYISKDGGAAAASNDVNPTELDATNMKGLYVFDLTQAESNCDLFKMSPVSTTANVVIYPRIIYTKIEQTGDSYGVVNNGTHGNAALKTLIDDVPTVSEFNARSTSDPATVTNQEIIAGYLDTEVAAIKAKTDLIPADPATATNQTAIANAVAGLNNIAVADILGALVEEGYTVQDIFKILGAMAAGKASGSGTNTLVFRDLADTLDRLTITKDDDNNRVGITLDLG